MRATFLSISLIIAMLTGACSHQQAFVISGASLDAVGNQFVMLSMFMDEGAKDGSISEEKYNKWAKFGTKFQMAFPAAVHLWKVAMYLDDPGLRMQAMDIILVLVPELLSIAEDAGLKLPELK